MAERKVIEKGIAWYEAAKDNADYNLVAVAYTPWHAISIDALIAYLRFRGVLVNAAIVITAHPVTGYALDESFFTNDCSTFYYDDSKRSISEEKSVDERYAKSSKIQKIMNYYKSIFSINKGYRDMYYVTNSFAILNVVRQIQDELHKNVIITYSEEGVASYMGTISDPNVIGIKGIKGIRNFIRYQVFGNYLYRALHPSIQFKIFKRTFSGLKLNELILPYYRKAIDSLNKKKDFAIDKNMVSNSYILCTTAWQREEVIDDADLKVLYEICQDLKQRGENILLKSHPRDKFFKKHVSYLGASLLDIDAIPMECVCAECHPKGIISFSSTVLITANVLGHIPTYCVLDMLDHNLVGEIYQKEMKSFKETFEKYTHFIQSAKEIV